jgi:coenzyme F420-0:L-glutamate ligase
VKKPPYLGGFFIYPFYKNLMNVHAVKTTIFKEGDSLVSFIKKHLPQIQENSILIITSKIVALAEKRTVVIETIRTKEECIRRESDVAIPTKYAWLTIKDGVVMAAAGIDESNANGKLILLPKNSFRSAKKLRKELLLLYGVQNLGVLITDSRTLPLRAGVTGVALGYAGFRGIKDYRGKPDIFGRKFKVSRVDVADSLATAAVYTMGEGNEQKPLAVITDSGVQFCKKVDRNELRIDIEDDMYQPLFTNLKH